MRGNIFKVQPTDILIVQYFCALHYSRTPQLDFTTYPPKLQYEKIKMKLATADNRGQLLLLQALRWVSLSLIDNLLSEFIVPSFSTFLLEESFMNGAFISELNMLLIATLIFKYCFSPPIQRIVNWRFVYVFFSYTKNLISFSISSF